MERHPDRAGDLAARGADIIPPNHNDDYFERIYDAAGEDPQSYRDAITRSARCMPI